MGKVSWRVMRCGVGAAGAWFGAVFGKVVGRFAPLTVITYRGRVFPLQFVGGNGVPNPDVTEGDPDG
jgi:hypothetical protein